MDICCNSCWSNVSEKAFRTSCLHVFCSTCAQEVFSRNQFTSCPVCSSNVNSNEDIKEFQVVGGPIPEPQLIELQNMLFAVATANGSHWISRQLEVLGKFHIAQLEGKD